VESSPDRDISAKAAPIIPGHGRICTKPMHGGQRIIIVRDQPETRSGKGMTLDQVKAARLTRTTIRATRRCRRSRITANFVESVYRDLSGKSR
jgi:hypothetical protein